MLPGLGKDFTVTPLNKDNSYQPQVSAQTFNIRPGTYLIQKRGISTNLSGYTKVGVIGLREFVAPAHQPASTISAAGSAANAPRSTTTTNAATNTLNSKGLSLFDSRSDNNVVVFYSPDWKTDPYEFIETAGQRILRMTHKPTAKTIPGGVETFVNRLDNEEILMALASDAEYNTIVVRAAAVKNTSVKITLIGGDAVAYSSIIRPGNQLQDITIPLSAFKRDAFILLPRPYPGFQALDFFSKENSALQWRSIDKIQFIMQGKPEDELSADLANIRLEIK